MSPKVPSVELPCSRLWRVGEGRWSVKSIQECLDAASLRAASTLVLWNFLGFDDAVQLLTQACNVGGMRGVEGSRNQPDEE